MSLRCAAVLLAMAPVVGVALAAPDPPPKPDPKEQAAAEALKKAGFKLEVAKGDPRLRVTDASWPEKFDPNPPTLEASDLARLRDLPNLQSLSLQSADEDISLGEEAARHLAGLHGIEIFMTHRVQFRPGTIAVAAAGMRGLTSAHLSHCHISGDDVDALGKHPKLRHLGLPGTDITDADLGRFSKPGAFPKLNALHLTACKKVTAEGVAALRKACPELRILD